MTSNILTYTMSNITINEYFIQSQSVVCSIIIHDDGRLVCNLTRYWVEKGQGTILVVFENQCDFRTVVQLDISSILTEAIDRTTEICQIKSAELYDNNTQLSECDPNIFKDTWNLCHDGINVDGHIFRLSEFRVLFKIMDVIEHD